MSENLFREERLQLIMDMLNAQKKVFVKELADTFNVSASSIRLDLAELEDRDLINRTHGGAILAENISGDYVASKSYLNLREQTFKDEKQRIGQAVIKLINDGDSIIMDGGSTIHYVSMNLAKKRDLTIITSSVHILPTLMEIPDAKIFLTGGLIHREFEDTIGEISINSILRFKPDWVIMSMDAVSMKHGFTTTDPSMAQIKKQMLSVSSRSIIALDSSKFGKVCLHHVEEITGVNVVVTDNKVSEEYVDFLINSPVTLISA